MGLETFNQLSDKEKERFESIVNKLFASCFIYKHLDKDFYFIVTHQDLFKDYFAIANWNLTIDNMLDTIYITNLSGKNRYRFNLKESILLLLLRTIFEEQSKSVGRSDKILCSVGDLLDRYAALKLKEKNIDKNSLLSALSLFRRFNIIESLTSSELLSNAIIAINPVILVAVQVQDIKEVYDKIESISKNGGNENVSIEEVETN